MQVYITLALCVYYYRNTHQKKVQEKNNKKRVRFWTVSLRQPKAPGPSDDPHSSVAMAIYYMSMINKFSQGENKLFNNCSDHYNR